MSPGALLAALLAALFVCSAAISTARAQTLADEAAPESSSVLDGSVEQRVGSLLRQAVASGRISAAVLVFVRDGKLRIQEAFGYEDPQRLTPVTTAESRFSVNSITKTFAAVALAQLKANGQIRSYDDPANRYLRTYQLPDSSGKPITLEELATHTAGFDEDLFDMFAARPEPGIPRESDYKSHQPPYFMPPGQLPVYSGFGIDILGLVVADVTRMPYPAYIEQSILAPLGMTKTLVEYPEGPILHLVHAFQPGDPRNSVPVLFRKPFSLPEGVVLMTGDDMGRYLMALLDRSGRQHAITPAMQDDMFKLHHAVIPGGVGYGLVFEVSRVRSRLLIYHRGGGNGMVCNLAMVPSESAGLFECIASTPPVGGFAATVQPLDPAEVDEAVFAALAAGAADDPQIRAGSEASRPSWQPSWSAYLGDYVWTERHHFGFGRLSSILHPNAVRVERGKGGLKIGTIDGLTEISPGRFGAPSTVETFSFFEEPSIGRMILSRSMNATSFELPGPLDAPRVMSRVLAALLAIAATGLLWPLWPSARGAPAARAAAVLLAVCMLGGTAVLFGFHTLGDRYFVGVGWPIVFIRTCGFLIIPIAGVLAVTALTLCRARLAGTAALARVHLGILAAAAWVAVGALIDVGVIGFLTR
jgi:CubicO group peptidase (beta-lactamase class C family)